MWDVAHWVLTLYLGFAAVWYCYAARAGDCMKWHERKRPEKCRRYERFRENCHACKVERLRAVIHQHVCEPAPLKRGRQRGPRWN